ncbi:UDP-N-acetylmuramate:L-alanyl-gamma-D-glutamyl-m eso-diaminopimelate ligase [Desulfonema ishimotonii]|uniref:UDP-N-acetylmuramate:L-alanyl-gamma-D-glutamyl-m eso-diaminopimelate ligase n=1 Tax=Desulfonema ishimotonii TaxID=45657 RepID=A0A401FYL5_9BACT|nr:UDP-N-acetylmuramate:L-alanyl-gamma-D-glutamyl-meso-diaminopimelate ligase [Desulfonema ishimotonii]GBC62036.1 UDP-N-acetylmuramate:L-alanyl-gamma-D-glutamyl-m eso-diaminopimelate ligase [Desulfonema ishimotonii]
MDLSKNRIPGTVEKIHLIAVCGTGMGALAGMLRDLGYQVTGSDQGIYPPMSEFLDRKGIPVTEGFDAGSLAYRPDLVIVGNAVTRLNPEAQAMSDMGLNFCSMPQAINHFIAGDKKVLMVTGTHGKTTTCSILAWMLYEAGLDPAFFIGGILRDFNSNYRMGKGEYIVIEGDEYDTAFFDKGPKFVHYDPLMAVLTGVEFDHADIFRDLEHVKSFFDRLLSKMTPESTLMAFDANENVADLVRDRACRVLKYGGREDSPWRLGAVRAAPPWTVFEVLKYREPFGRFRTKLVGRHNLLNALSAIAVADRLGISADAIGRALETFQGPKRRQEVRGVKNGVTVMDDFAHHPTAVRETIRAVRPFYPDGRLIAVFEPRTNTSMRDVFQDVYATVFDDADMICIRKPSRLDKVPENERFSSEKLVNDLNARGESAYHSDDTDGIIAFLTGEARPGDVVLVMSNGGFDNIHERLLDAL